MPTRREALAASAALTGGAILSVTPAAPATEAMAAESGPRPGGAIALTGVQVPAGLDDRLLAEHPGGLTAGRSAAVGGGRRG
ncbi:hypothetical protein [Embleya sp. AB8]|uniref:hypothetical protein n=1 Tax=Embleya sp. AB8 TaxID=3156304 RepID=UPI003C74913E